MGGGTCLREGGDGGVGLREGGMVRVDWLAGWVSGRRGDKLDSGGINGIRD